MSRPERASRLTPILFLAFLLGASLVAIQPAGAFPVTGPQATQAQNAFGPGAPHMAWTPRVTTNEFFPRSAPTGDGVVPWTDGPDLAATALDATEPVAEAVIPYTLADGADGTDHGEQALISCVVQPSGNNDCLGGVIGPARFPLTDSLAPVDPIQVYRFGGEVWAGCGSSLGGQVGGLDGNAAGLAGLSLRLIRQVKDDAGNWVDDPSVGSTANANVGVIANALLEAVPILAGAQVNLYAGSTTVGNAVQGTGPIVAPGQRLLVQIEVDAGLNVDDHCVIYYGRDFSDAVGVWGGKTFVALTSNAERFALFPANEQARLATGFPSASSTDSANRRFHIEALVATAFGPDAAFMEQLKGKHANVRIYDATNEKYLYYVDEYNTGNGRGFPPDFNIKEIELVSSRADDLSPQSDIEEHIGQGILRRSFVFQYPATLPDIPRVEPQFYSYGDSWELKGPQFSIGGKGFQFELASFDSATHTVNPGEPTEFYVLLRNTGTAADSVAVAVGDPGAGWTARAQGGGLYFLTPGSAALVAIEVVPPATATAGTQRTVSVRASSSFSDVADPDPIALTAQVVSATQRGVSLVAQDSVFKVGAGQEKSFALTLINEGTRRDSFTVIPSFPSTVEGWSIRTVPSSAHLVSGGMQQVQVIVRAPAEAPNAMSFPLGLTAVEVGNAAVNDRVDVTVEVISAVGGLVGLLDPGVERKMREDGDDQCLNAPGPTCGADAGTPAEGTLGTPAADTDFDRSVLFRIPISNPSSRPESFRVEAVWDTLLEGVSDGNRCDGDPGGPGANLPDGVPDGWRYRWWNGELGAAMPAAAQTNGLGANQDERSTNRGFAGRFQLNGTDAPLVVPAGQTLYAYLEVGNVGEYLCQVCIGVCTTAVTPLSLHDVNSGDSPVAGMTLTATSIRDPSFRQTVSVVARIEAAGGFVRTNEWEGGTHLPAIELGPGQKDNVPVSAGQPAVFNLVAINKANEKDGLKITVSGAAGWTHAIVPLRTVPGSLPCNLPAADGSVTCLGLGIYDEVHFQVVAVPGPLADVGDRSPITVTVTSTDAPGIARTLGLVARFAGTYDFDVLPRGATTRTVSPGAPVSFPFVVRNDGTADDSYRLSWVTGAPTWQPTLETAAPVFVPAGSEIPTLFTVVAPAASAAGATDTFRLRVESVGSGIVKTFEVTPVAQPASGLRVFGKDGQDVLIPTRGTDTPVTIRAVQSSGVPATQATLTVDTLSLPPRWTVDRASVTVNLVPDADGVPAGEAVFKVRAPSDALGSAHGLLRVEAATVGSSPLRAATDVRLNLASTFGVDLNATDENGTKMVIAPGGSAVFNLTVHNRGLGTDTVRLTNTQLPQGWALLFNPGTLELGPLQERTVEVKVLAPTSAQPADIASFVVFASSVGSSTEIDSIALQAQVGFNALRVEQVGSAVPAGAPQEAIVWVLNVTNTGTLPDEVRLGGTIDTTAVRSLLNMSSEPARFLLDPNQTAQVRVTALLAETIPSDLEIVSTITATSLLDERAAPAEGKAVLKGRVLPYAVLDVNSDSRRDYAVDRDGDAANGFEEFRGNVRPGGRPLAAANLTHFLTEDALASFQRDVTLENGSTVRVTRFLPDGDGDGKADHLLDTDGDDQPDFYWDPDANKASRIEFRKDVNGDQVPESFIDASGDGAVDVVYDLTRGTFTKVLQLDVDNDGQLDYIVDKDGDGQVDADETVLYTRTGRLLIVQKVDVDGDGRLDQVFDTDGDGNPDYFVPAGSTESVAIVLRDLNGDGTMDWTFDGDGDGRRESYYDPVTGRAHVIDATGHFMDSLREYWYIGALFALVLVLFVALVAVTRR